MLIKDSIYGEITITDPLIIDLINATPLQRLKEIDQHGARQYISPESKTTRFEHSVGAWYLSATFKRPIAEQVASLLHDIPHTAFSHVIDVVMEDKNHEYHDRFLEHVINHSEIPAILEKHNLSLKKVLAKDSYPLLNNNLPDISVDRWDYFMRDGYTYGVLPKQTIDLFLSSMKEKEQKFYFSDIRIARLFAILFMNFSRLLWLDPTSHGSFFILAHAIKQAMVKGYITEKDFFDTDAVLMEKLKKTNDPEIIKQLTRLKPGLEFQYAPKNEAEFYGMNKPRYVDPWVLHKNELVHLSTITPGLKDYFEEFKNRYQYIGVKEVQK